MVGAGAATYHLAYQLADSFGVIVHDDRLRPELIRRIQFMGCLDRMTSMRSFNVPILEMRERKQEVEGKFIEIAQHQIKEENAQLIVEGCLAILFHMGDGARERVEQRLGVPVLEGSGIAIKTAETVVGLKLTHSKMTYPSPIPE